MFKYYLLELLLRTEMLGTCAEGSIMEAHVFQKAKKNIKAANALEKRMTKLLEKFVGPELEDRKLITDLQGIYRAYQQFTGDATTPPSDDLEILRIQLDAQKAAFEELIAKADAQKCTVFMLGADGWPIISTHMIIGNLKENLTICVNNGDKSLFKYKTTVQESLALDVKPVEDYMRPSNDINRDAEGKPKLLERPLRTTDMNGHTLTAIAMSQTLPVGTTMSCHLRVRATSAYTPEVLKKLLSYGKNNGLGQWRGSGHKGSYDFRLTEVENDPMPPAEGWE